MRLPRKAPDNTNGVVYRIDLGDGHPPLSSVLCKGLIRQGLGVLSLNDLSALGRPRLAMLAMAPLWSGRN